MRYFTSIAICLLTFLACNKNEEDVLAGDDTVFFLNDLGKGITKNLMAMRHTHDSLHNPVQDTSTAIYFSNDSITPGEFSPLRKELKIVQAIVRKNSQGAGVSHYYDYYTEKSGSRSRKLLKLVTTVSADTIYSLHRYAFASNDHITADTTIAWNTFVAGIDTSVTYYY